MVIAARAPGRLELVPHPNPLFAAHFSTGSDPKESPIAEEGYLGFGSPGYAPAPEWPGPVLGAVCVQDTFCVRITKKESDYYGSQSLWFGENVFCTSDICRKGAVTGACCLPTGECRIMTRKSCVQQAASYQGDGSTCVPDPCASGAGGGGGKGPK